MSADREREWLAFLSDTLDREPDAVWEPWSPVVGDRVRFQRGECAAPHGCIPDGVRGRVSSVAGPPAWIPWSENRPTTGHRFMVWLDHGIDCTPCDQVHVGLMAAAIELEPAAARPAGTGEGEES